MRNDRAPIWRLAAAFALTCGLNPAAEFPQAEIFNGLMRAKVYLPDAERGYYRGVRFDWSGVVASLTYKGHEFFGQWFEKYDPLLHDAVTGPVEEFRDEKDGALGYAEAKPRGMFVKIGVGVLRKPDDEPYNFARTYTMLNPGKRVVRTEGDHIDFVQELSDGEGYAYEYTKTLRLPRGKAQLVLEHALKNTGRHVLETDVYNHDFFMLDHIPTGVESTVKFSFAPKPKDELKAPLRIEGNEIGFQRELRDKEWVGNWLSGWGDSASDNDIRVENTKAGIGVRQTSDRPVTRIYFWSTRATVCPEVYVHLKVEPGKTIRWRVGYEFYLLP